MLASRLVLGGRYELAERIGAGGFSEVWRATDLVLARPVAVQEDWTDGYRLRVVNDVPPQGAAEHRSTGHPAVEGHGLLGMTERVAELGGRVSAGESGGRWITEVTIPGRAS